MWKRKRATPGSLLPDQNGLQWKMDVFIENPPCVPLARAAALFTGSQCIKLGSSCRACDAKEVIKTELKWLHNKLERRVRKVPAPK